MCIAVNNKAITTALCIIAGLILLTSAKLCGLTRWVKHVYTKTTQHKRHLSSITVLSAMEQHGPAP